MTYEGFAAAWPSRTNEFADKFNSMPKYVVSSTRLMIFPVVLGSGKRLFGDRTDKKRLRLADSKTVGDGITILIFQRAGEVANREAREGDNRSAIRADRRC